MFFLINLFFLVDLFFLIDFLNEAALDVYKIICEVKKQKNFQKCWFLDFDANSSEIALYILLILEYAFFPPQFQISRSNWEKYCESIFANVYLVVDFWADAWVNLSIRKYIPTQGDIWKCAQHNSHSIFASVAYTYIYNFCKLNFAQDSRCLLPTSTSRSISSFHII